jgi:hypothetical protein
MDEFRRLLADWLLTQFESTDQPTIPAGSVKAILAFHEWAQGMAPQTAAPAKQKRKIDDTRRAALSENAYRISAARAGLSVEEHRARIMKAGDLLRAGKRARDVANQTGMSLIAVYQMRHRLNRARSPDA